MSYLFDAVVREPGVGGFPKLPNAQEYLGTYLPKYLGVLVGSCALPNQRLLRRGVSTVIYNRQG